MASNMAREWRRGLHKWDGRHYLRRMVRHVRGFWWHERQHNRMDYIFRRCPKAVEPFIHDSIDPSIDDDIKIGGCLLRLICIISCVF
uniref:Uncharacterized protein n=1 Tax=Cucumis melo TaxID=3656 RepID=A0A9I9CHD0_CUCME